MAKIFTGKIVKKSGKNTVKVMVERVVSHPIYRKHYKISKYFLVDDRSSKHEIGETVTITETRPISKRKHFKII